MAENADEDIILENGQASWQMHILGDVNGLYTGKFVFKCFLQPLDKISASREYRQLLGEHALLADQHETFLAYALTQLKYRIVSAPPFWASTDLFNGNIADENVITAVLDAAVRAEVKYRKSLKKATVETLTKAKAVAERLADNAAIDEEVEADDRKNTSQK